MKFKLNDKVKMLTCTEWWQKGDIGKIVDISDYKWSKNAKNKVRKMVT